MKRKTKVLIADDHPIFRHGLAQVIGQGGGVEVVGEADDGAQAVDLVQELGIDIAILDIDMPVLDGIEAAKQVRDRSPETKVIFLTMHKDRSIMRSMGPLDVRGYVLKDSAMEEILECIEEVLEGSIYLSPALSGLSSGSPADDFEDTYIPALKTLTPAERNVLSMITDSRKNSEIAEALFISVRTVETHRYNICSKLNLNGSHALFKFAVKNRSKIKASLED